MAAARRRTAGSRRGLRMARPGRRALPEIRRRPRLLARRAPAGASRLPRRAARLRRHRPRPPLLPRTLRLRHVPARRPSRSRGRARRVQRLQRALPGLGRRSHAALPQAQRRRSAPMTLQQRVDRARRLLAAIEKNHSPTALASSFGAEDMVLLDLIARDGLGISIFTLDTGRLPAETHDLIARVRKQYGLEIDVYAPWPESVDACVAEHGIDGFYDGVEQRKACCAVRKVEPLRRALAGKRGWITG